MLGAVHPAVVLVKKKHRGTTERKRREHPGGPGRFQNAAGALKLKDAQSKENHGERLVLQILVIAGETVPPTLGTERPQLRVTEDEQEKPGKQKTRRPREAQERRAVGQRALSEEKNGGENEEESSQMVVEFTIFLVGQEPGLLGSVHERLFVHGHGHGLVSGVVCMHGVIPGRG